MIRRLVVAICVAIGAISAAEASAVEASPTWCSTSHTVYTATANCAAGTGRFRVVAQTAWGYYGGTCVAVGYISRVFTPVPVLSAYATAC